MVSLSEGKANRLLDIYTRLVNGAVLNKAELAQQFQITTRSVQRDIESLRCFFADRLLEQDIIYDSRAKGYRLVGSISRQLSNSEILAVCKILLESRSMRRDEMLPILDKLIDCCIPEENKKTIAELVANEKYHYIEPHHGRPLLNGLWDLGQAVRNRQMLELTYERMKEPKLVSRKVKPVGIMFSEYYFYLTAFLDDKVEFQNPNDFFPTIYRIDRIQKLRVLDEHFSVPYRDRFEEGEFRKRVQFMYGGKLETVKFVYTGLSIESVLDRLPTAVIIDEQDGAYTVQAEVFGKGIEMWMRSQGDYVRRLEV